MMSSDQAPMESGGGPHHELIPAVSAKKLWRVLRAVYLVLVKGLGKHQPKLAALGVHLHQLLSKRHHHDGHDGLAAAVREHPALTYLSTTLSCRSMDPAVAVVHPYRGAGAHACTGHRGGATGGASGLSSLSCRSMDPASAVYQYQFRPREEWVYFLNKGSQIEVVYRVEPEAELPYPLCITIAKGKEGFTQWTGKPSVHNTTLLWHLVHGTGTIKQTINLSYEYYIAVRNLNDQDTVVLLDFRIRTMFYNTTVADYICSPGHALCTYRLPLLGQNVAVLSSGLKERLNTDDEQYVTRSYEPRWIVYVVGSVALLILYEILSALLGLCNGGSPIDADHRTSLLVSKEDEDASLGSSYDSVSHDGEDDDVEGKDEAGRHLCVVCCDARKDYFFLPCGHSATCHSCGTRIVEEDGSCPFCRRKLKKVRRIFAV